MAGTSETETKASKGANTSKNKNNEGVESKKDVVNTKKGFKNIKRKSFDKSKTPSNYRLTNSRTGESFLVKVGRNKQLIIYDESSKVNRVIRHCPNEQSIYLDEQSDHAIVETIEFQYGRLTVLPEQVSTYEFLQAHPDNVANGGRIFELEDEEKQATNDIEIEEVRLDIKSKIREFAKDSEEGIIVLERLVSTLIGSVANARKLDVAGLKRRLYIEADNNPKFFTDDKGNITAFDDDFLQVKYLVLVAINDGVLAVNNSLGTVKWVDTDDNIISVARGKNIVDEFANYLIDEENQLTLAELIERL